MKSSSELDPSLKGLSFLEIIYKKIRDRSRRLLKPILAEIYLRKLTRYPSLELLLNQYADSKSAAIDYADSLALFEQVLQRSPNYFLS